jgi:hypothetical protein
MVRGIVLITVIFLSSLSQAQLGDIIKRATHKDSTDTSISGLSNDKINAGLREALRVSTDNAVRSTGRPDGFLKNEAIKILIPDKLKNVSKGMRMIGMGQQVDDFEVAMNRAAEQAAPEAKQIFINALMNMSIQDARQILTGGNTAATEYFKRQSTDQLTTAFAPIVHQAMENVGVIRKYNSLAKSPAAGVVLGRQNFDLDQYVVGKTLDGLFYVLGQEETKIRQNPAARTTAILQQVFGRS